MDDILKEQLSKNAFNYKMTLNRVIDTYSKLQYCDGGMEVDLENTKYTTLRRYMKKSKAELNMLESKSLAELRDESMRALDIRTDSQLDFTHQNSGADETCFSKVSGVSSLHISVEDDGEVSTAGMCRSDTTQLTVSSLDESQRTVCEAADQQPEDEDEQLEMTLRRNGSLIELYPSMINQIGSAWRRQHVSEAADSVLRRYRRWRSRSNRSVHLDNTFTVNKKHKNNTERRRSSKENCGSPVKRHFMDTEHSLLTSLQMRPEWQAQQQQSPGRGRSLLTRKPILVMDLSCPLESFNTKETSLNQTFTVSLDESRSGEPLSAYPASPSKLSFPSPKAPSDFSLRSKRLSNAAHQLQTDGYLLYASQSTAAKERPDIYGSPVRQSPLKSRMMSSLSGSPSAFCRSPRAVSVESCPRELMRPRPVFTSLSSPQHRAALPPRMFCSQDSGPSFQAQPASPRSASAESRRHLSFDSFPPPAQNPKKLDEVFIKLYHKFVCQNQSSFFKGPPCRFCARSSEGSRCHSSLALAALALSPHRSVLRKRHRELNWDSFPQSKRLRDEYCPSSPGSKRHRTELLRRRFSTFESEQRHDGRTYSPGKHSQQRPAEHHHQEEGWMSHSRRPSAAEFSGYGSSFERNAASGSPRKWW
ncbi:uncharacterized protein si:dkeyp-117h8.4 [Labrus bergylta]|uniref:uncharacterized protein si:dkeyp-117h8.4 n=1 Tax=Labrus bergylta TaxID=56723 RepID=UPI0033140E3E